MQLLLFRLLVCHKPPLYFPLFCVLVDKMQATWTRTYIAISFHRWLWKKVIATEARRKKKKTTWKANLYIFLFFIFCFFLFWPMFSLHLSTQNVNSLVRTRSFPGQESKQYFSPFLNLMKKSTEILFLSDTRLDANKLKFLENQFSFTDIIGVRRQRIFIIIIII